MHRVTSVTSQKEFNHKALNTCARPSRNSQLRRGTEAGHPRLIPSQSPSTRQANFCNPNSWILGKGRRVMAGVVFVFVREDASEVETLADVFDDAGYSITGSENAELRVVVWSRRALRSETFRAAADNGRRVDNIRSHEARAQERQEDVVAAARVDGFQLCLAPKRQSFCRGGFGRQTRARHQSDFARLCAAFRFAAQPGYAGHHDFATTIL
mgnify:CR=1 FL=1